MLRLSNQFSDQSNRVDSPNQSQNPEYANNDTATDREHKMPNERKAARYSSILRILRVIEEVEEEELSDYKNRPSSLISYPKES